MIKFSRRLFARKLAPPVPEKGSEVLDTDFYTHLQQNFTKIQSVNKSDFETM